MKSSFVAVRSAVCAGCLFIFLTVSASAHEIRPAVVTLAADGDHVAVAIALNAEALMANIGPQHKDTNDAPETVAYTELRAVEPDAVQARFKDFSSRWLEGVVLEVDGRRVPLAVTKIEVPPVGNSSYPRISVVHLDGPLPASSATLRWSYAAKYGSSVVRFKRVGEATREIGWLKDGAASEPISIAGGNDKSALSKFVSYVVVGYTHIVPKGLDHILFVVGLYLLGTQWRPLLIQVTAFTVAHSITLALGMYGVLSVSPAIVEPLIALSIVYVAVENIMTSKLTYWRPVIVFAFGLLHGLGFASVLREIDLPRDDFVLGLIGFNVGVEFGQLSVILAAFLSTGLWFRNRPWYRHRVVWPASAAIALVGAFWTVERLLAA
jgi:hydrogenase/urease accessory protein HupE